MENDKSGEDRERYGYSMGDISGEDPPYSTNRQAKNTMQWLETLITAVCNIRQGNYIMMVTY